MKLEKIVAITGMSGLHRMIANRTNGLIVEELTTGKRKFAPARKHQFTPLESIGIYTNDGNTTDLKVVFATMLAQSAENPPIASDSSPKELHEYFARILPNYDRDKVSTGDIKKMIKWFGILQQQGMLEANDTENNRSGEQEE